MAELEENVMSELEDQEFEKQLEGATGGDGQGTPSLSNEFDGIPMELLIKGPLTECGKTHEQIKKYMDEFDSNEEKRKNRLD